MSGVFRCKWWILNEKISCSGEQNTENILNFRHNSNINLSRAPQNIPHKKLGSTELPSTPSHLQIHLSRNLYLKSNQESKTGNVGWTDTNSSTKPNCTEMNFQKILFFSKKKNLQFFYGSTFMSGLSSCNLKINHRFGFYLLQLWFYRAVRLLYEFKGVFRWPLLNFNPGFRQNEGVQSSYRG